MTVVATQDCKEITNAEARGVTLSKQARHILNHSQHFDTLDCTRRYQREVLCRSTAEDCIVEPDAVDEMQDRRTLEPANDRRTLSGCRLLQEHADRRIKGIGDQLVLLYGFTANECQAGSNLLGTDRSPRCHDKDFIYLVLLRKSIGKDQGSQQRRDEMSCRNQRIRSGCYQNPEQRRGVYYVQAIYENPEYRRRCDKSHEDEPCLRDDGTAET